MPKQRDIREKALLSLFASNGDIQELSAESPLWELCLEPEDEKIRAQTAKVINHQLQAFPKTAEELLSNISLFIPILLSYEGKDEAKQLKRVSKSLEKLLPQYQQINKGSSKSELARFFQDAASLSGLLNVSKSSLASILLDDPLRSKVEHNVSRLQEFLQRLKMIQTPLDHAEEPAVSTLIKSSQDRAVLQEKATELVNAVLSKLTAIDPLLEESLENFSHEQLGKVERSILRLSAYEILFLETPKAIAINESLEIARRYSTDDAVPLINGVLDNLSSKEG